MTNDRFLVEAKGLVLRHGRKVATRGIDLAVPRGSVTALLGRNGAGKSTFLDACMGLIPVTQGSLRVFGGNALGRIVAPRSYLASGVHLFTATEWACQFALLFGATFYCGLMSPRSAGAVSGLIIIVFGANVFGRVADEVWLNHWEVPEQALPTIQNWWLASLGLGFGLAAWQVMTRSDLHRGRLLRPLAISVPVLILSLVPSAAFGHRQLMTWVETLPTDPVVKIESIALLMTNDGPRLSLIMKKPGFRRALEGILIDPSTGASKNLGFARYLVAVGLDGKSLLGIDVHPRLGSIKDSEYGRWVADASGQSLPAENWPPHRRSHRHALGVFENWQVRLTQTGSKVGILVVNPVGDVAAHHIPHGDEFGHRLFGSRVWMIRGGQRNEGTPPDLVSLDLRTGAETTRAFPEAQARRAAIPEWNVIVGPNRVVQVEPGGHRLVETDLADGSGRSLWASPEDSTQKIQHVGSHPSGRFIYYSHSREGDLPPQWSILDRRSGTTEKLPEGIDLFEFAGLSKSSPSGRFVLGRNSTTEEFIVVEPERGVATLRSLEFEGSFYIASWLNDHELIDVGPRRVRIHDLETDSVRTIYELPAPR